MSHRPRHVLICTTLMISLLSATAFASPTLKSGSTGHDVMLLQEKLSEIGYAVGTHDGVFGRTTERAVAEFQRDQNMHITGVVNSATWRALKKARKRPAAGTHASKPVTIDRKAAAEIIGSSAGTGRTQQRQSASLLRGKAVLPRSKVPALLRTAKSYIGTPYGWGGTTPKAFDCSGYLQYVFARNGITIPRLADEQYLLGSKRSPSLLEPGDLVFFTTYEPGASHCGIYLGSGQFIHASSSKGVRIDSLSNAYWQPRYYGGKHIIM